RKIEYRTAEGRDLKGWILLPVGYESGKKYPAVVVIYPGMMQGDNPPGGHARNINNHSALNFQLLAARGYAVLYPSIPLKPEGETSDPLPEVSKGVLPAVDMMIETGVADPDRLGVIGHSYGGYGVYGLLAQTKRFKAGVSLAGLSELISLYGTIDARFRYDRNAHERWFGMSLAETGQLRMGSAPWKDTERYIRNSPIFSADKIDTPLMIIQGDLDYIAIQQGEQMFSALHRQNKRASFVRYWGEGHVIEGPANVQDMWRRIFAWFDEFLGAKAYPA
ncbi:MAG TPA: prolyl oligopeptidase family serine peptidase, partial [Pyrinomonadaceae bacterium]|nr:prolyl oligopeptidase family serine peptidase [Pyrinomonadaceae bacterium]